MEKWFAKDINNISSSGFNPKEWEEIPDIKQARPKGKGYVEVSLQKISIPGGKLVNIVQWHGAKMGRWYPEGPMFVVSKREIY